MTARRGGGARLVVGWLRVDCGQAAGGGRWVRFPAADYACVCGWTAAASGDQVSQFVAGVRRGHVVVCPVRSAGATP